jgi:mono/diheme cytochrome c family protein
LYGKYCVHCHGKSGQADGPVASKLISPPPSYSSPALLALPEGKMFHTITYGKGLMGSHSSQVSKDERWKIIMYIQKLQHPDGEVAAAPKAEEPVVAAVMPKAHKAKK